MLIEKKEGRKQPREGRRKRGRKKARKKGITKLVCSQLNLYNLQIVRDKNVILLCY